MCINKGSQAWSAAFISLICVLISAPAWSQASYTAQIRGVVAKVGSEKATKRVTPGASMNLHEAHGANPRSGRPLKLAQRAAQALELIVEPLVLRELIFDLLDARLDVLGDRADVGNLGHVTPPRVWVTS